MKYGVISKNFQKSATSYIMCSPDKRLLSWRVQKFVELEFSRKMIFRKSFLKISKGFEMLPYSLNTYQYLSIFSNFFVTFYNLFLKLMRIGKDLRIHMQNDIVLFNSICTFVIIVQFYYEFVIFCIVICVIM